VSGPDEPPLYDTIGGGYATTRRADPRIAAAIDRALDDARTIVNVGAGTGSYEPTDREVTAVEPSAAMIAQRPPGAAPAVQGVAEALPFDDVSFDAALATMTLHHWNDVWRGLAELRRVARDRVVILTWDPAVAGASWLIADYLPELLELDLFRFPEAAAISSALGGAEVWPVPIPRDCRDGFIEAFWARPEAYLAPSIRAGASGMRALGPAVVEPAMDRLAADLDSGAWDRRHGHLRELGELDLGYRLVVA
jgi:SAM-dependent methyltransferase